MQAAANVLLFLMDRLLQLLVPPKANRLCYLSIPDHTDNAYYVYRHALQTRESLEHVWLVTDEDAEPWIHREFDTLTSHTGPHGNQLKVIKRRSLAGYFAYLRSRYAFHTHGAYAFSNWAFRRHVVCLWHGMPIKAVGRLNAITPNPKPPFGTTHVATSHLWRYVIACAFSDGVAAAVEVCSLPRCDALRYPESRGTPAHEVKERLGLAPERPLILWMPTYRSQLSSSDERRLTARADPGEIATAPQPSFLDDLPEWVLPALISACAELRATVLVKLHPFDTLNAAGQLPEYEHVRILTAREWLRTDMQLYDLVAAADGLLSDISSVIIDYLVTTKPLGLTSFSLDDYDRELLLPLELFHSSRRFQILHDEGSIHRFVTSAANGEAVHLSAGDAASVLYDRFDQPGSEAVLQSVGL